MKEKKTHLCVMIGIISTIGWFLLFLICIWDILDNQNYIVVIELNRFGEFWLDVFFSLLFFLISIYSIIYFIIFMMKNKNGKL